MDLRIGCGGRCARAGSVGAAGWRCAPCGRCVLICARLLVLLCGGLLCVALPVMYLLAVGLLCGIPPAAGPENGAQTAQAGCRRASCALPRGSSAAPCASDGVACRAAYSAPD